jgi:hypothetical protein
VTGLEVPVVQQVHYGNPQTVKISGSFANEGSTTDDVTVTLEAHYTLDFDAVWTGELDDTVEHGIFDGDFRSELRFVATDVQSGEEVELSRELTLRCPAPGFNFTMHYYVLMSVASDSGEDADPTDSSMTVNRNVMCLGSPPTTPVATITPTPTPTQPAKECGDVNLDGGVDAIDAQLVLQYVAALIEELSGMPSADTDGDGSIASTDALLILQFTAGLLDTKTCA